TFSIRRRASSARRRPARWATRKRSDSTRTACGWARRMQGGAASRWGGSMRGAMKLDKKSLSKYAETQRTPFEAALKEFVEIPTVSSEPERLPEIRRAEGLAGKSVSDD